METCRFAFILLLIVILSPDAEPQMRGRYRIQFKVGVKNIGNHDKEYWSSWMDWSDIYIKIYMGSSKKTLVGQTVTAPNVNLNHEFDKVYEIAYDGDRYQQMIVEVWDQELGYGDPKRLEDTHIGDSTIKMFELAQIGKHDYPIWNGHVEQEGRLTIDTRAVYDDWY